MAAAPLDIATLTRAMAGGDESAYRTFYDAYFQRLSRYLLVVTAGNEDAAREALQATLVRVVRHIKPFADESVFWSWLTVLARSAITDQTRKRRRYLAFLDRFTRHARAQQSVPEDTDAEAQLFSLLDRALEGLPEVERALMEQKVLRAGIGPRHCHKAPDLGEGSGVAPGACSPQTQTGRAG